ncbi:DUF4097 family beta strand repeat-containing protein [Paenibacillus thermotolerans]|uniref:DUF4097 family beta strand repeat-containing protein n=1 Tax=Paenibacillus thermotolerans TaxID=3027807 RepID=UPI00236794BF|nr:MULTISPECIES: DUF4097 family beta strand repeat-containing protein [unclassified Paenibacillus]
MNRIQKSMVAAVAAVMAVGLSGCGSFVERVNDSVMGESAGSGELVSLGLKKFDETEFDSVRVNTMAMTVQVERSEGSEASAELFVDKAIKNEFTYSAVLNGRTLELKVDEETTAASKRSFEKQQGQRRLVVKLPAKSLENVSVRNEFGEVEAVGLAAERLDIGVEAGEIRVREVNAEMDLQAGAGDIEADGIVLRHDLKAVTEAGQVRVKLSEQPEAAKLMLGSEMGEVKADLDGVDYTIRSRNAVVGTIGSGGPKLHLSTELGSVTLE